MQTKIYVLCYCYLQEEIKEFRENEKLMKLRSRLYKKCGVVLDDAGDVAEDKAVQADIVGEMYLIVLKIVDYVKKGL